MYRQIIFSCFLLLGIFHMSNLETKRVIENDYTQSIMAILENSITIKDDVREFSPLKARNLLSVWCNKNYPYMNHNIQTEEYKRNSISHLKIDFSLSINLFYKVQRTDSYEIAGKSV